MPPPCSPMLRASANWPCPEHLRRPGVHYVHCAVVDVHFVHFPVIVLPVNSSAYCVLYLVQLYWH